MPVIKEMFAFIIADKDEQDEGIPGFSTGQGVMPLVGADMNRANSLKEVAQVIANKSGKAVTLAKFSVREDVEVLQPVVGSARRLKPQSCPVCATLLDGASGFKVDASPKPGDLTVCLGCSAVLRFDDEMTFQHVPEQELRGLDQDDRRTLFEAREAIREVKSKMGGIVGGSNTTH